MASREGVVTALKLLAVNFAGEVTPDKVKLWCAALEDVSDEALALGVPRLIREHTGDFIPPVAVLRAACGANIRPVVDLEAARRAIAALGEHSPVIGWCAPPVEMVRERLGDVMADAYGAIGGGAQLFPSDNETGRSIAFREFGKELVVAAERAERLALPSGHIPKTLRAS